jgi:hypothetical protein
MQPELVMKFADEATEFSEEIVSWLVQAEQPTEG